jgi:hypothetical protein
MHLLIIALGLATLLMVLRMACDNTGPLPRRSERPPGMRDRGR